MLRGGQLGNGLDYCALRQLEGEEGAGLVRGNAGQD